MSASSPFLLFPSELPQAPRHELSPCDSSPAMSSAIHQSAGHSERHRALSTKSTAHYSSTPPGTGTTCRVTANMSIPIASPSLSPRTPELTALSVTLSSTCLPPPKPSALLLSSLARRFSSVRSRFSLPEPPPLLVRRLRALPMARVLRVPAARLPVVDVVADVAVVVVLAAPVALYVFCSHLRIPWC